MSDQDKNESQLEMTKPILEEITGGILRQDFPYILLYK